MGGGDGDRQGSVSSRTAKATRAPQRNHVSKKKKFCFVKQTTNQPNNNDDNDNDNTNNKRLYGLSYHCELHEGMSNYAVWPGM